MFEQVEIMDTTLRDGEQTDGVSFSSFEKVQISRFLLESLRVDRIEIASARVSEGERISITEVFAWATQKNLADRIEILGFTDHRASVDWILDCGGSVINLLTKGSRKHCEEQLGKNLKQHLADISRTIDYAHDKNVKVNVYLEDWSNGYLNSQDYVREMAGEITRMGIHRLFLPDTLGIMSPEEVFSGVRDILDRQPEMNVDFHAHNDYALATANCLSAVRAGAMGLHVAINGLGERAGNAPLESVVTALHDKLKIKTNVAEKAIMGASRLVETLSGKRIQSNRPIVGQDVYTQTAGIHADGDKKNNLYANPILPERFGRQRVYALGKLAGRASIANNLKMLGIELSAERETILLDRIKTLGEKKKTITADDLPFLIHDLFGSGTEHFVSIKDAQITSRIKGRPSASIEVEYGGKIFRGSGDGDGGYDAFMNALKSIAPDLNLKIPRLTDYEVRIPPGGKTDALVEAVISWDLDDVQGKGRTLRTVGVSPDQTIAAIRATEKMLNSLILAPRTESPVAVDS